jgi:ABC-2 type transport system permease protein
MTPRKPDAVPFTRVLTIAAAEFEQAVRSRAFLAGLLAVPLLMALAFGIQALTARRDTSERRFAIVDRTGVLGPVLVEAARESNAREVSPTGRRTGPSFLPELVTADTQAPDALRLALSERVRTGDLFAFVEIPADVLTAQAEAPHLQYHTEYPTYQALPDWLRKEVSRAVADRRLASLGADPTVARRLLEPIPLDRKGLVVRTTSGEVSVAEKVDPVRAFAMPAITMFMLFGLVMASAPQLLNSVIEEKTSRISEVLLGSVGAFHLMLGKLLGSVAVTMVLAVLYVGGGLLIAAQADYFGFIQWGLLPWFALFLVIAIFLYGAMFIAIGAACSEVKDAQGMMMPALMLSMFPIFLWLQVAQNPDSPMSVGFSLFPFAAPYLMLLRIAIPPGPPAWQVVLAVAGAIATTVAMVWAAGRILRVGLLMQGKTANYREMWRWIRAK